MSLIGILNFIFGYHIFECDSKDTEKLLNIFMQYRIIYWNLKKGDEKATFYILSKDARTLLTLAQRGRIPVQIIGVRGLFHILARYKKRVGIPIGLALFFTIVYVSGLFVWEINITGNTNVPKREIISLLSSSGLEVGSYIPFLDLDVIKNRALVDSNDLSWLTVNMNGTSANVIVREIEKGKNAGADEEPCNLVASCNAQIEMLEVYMGQPVVSVGDVVNEGDLLVSGIVANEKTGVRYMRSSGKIWARTTKTLHIEIPLEYEQKVYTGEEIRQKTIIFFGKSINLFVNSGNLPSNYDKIEREEPLTFFGRITVPVSMVTNEFREYTYKSESRSELEAAKLAHAKLSLEVSNALEGAELLKKTVKAEFVDGAYVIDCELYCIEDIAVEAEFETE